MAIQDLVDGNAGEHAQAQQGKSGGEADQDERECLKGVRHLCESGITRLPSRYVLPVSDRPGWSASGGDKNNTNLRLPVIDLARLRLRSERASVLRALDAACREFGFFQVVNHGFDEKVIRGTLDVARRFFEQPIEERARHMTSDIRSLVRYGTSFNQLNDGVLCWRDFLKLVCQPLDAVVPSWPHSPPDLREVVSAYARINQCLFKELMAALLEEMGICDRAVLDDCDAGTQMMIVNCFPACPQPDLTLGMPPHSDYGFLTILLQDEVNGLEVKYGDQWIMVEPLPNSFVVNIGDHFEIYSNGRYKSVMHRVRVNSTRSRISVASLHSLPLERVISPAPELVDERNPRRYRDTDFATFLNHLTSSDGKQKSFFFVLRIRHLIVSFITEESTVVVCIASHFSLDEITRPEQNPMWMRRRHV